MTRLKQALWARTQSGRCGARIIFEHAGTPQMPPSMKFHGGSSYPGASQRSSVGWNSRPIVRSSLPRRLQADAWHTGDGTLSEKGATSTWAAHNKFAGSLRSDANKSALHGQWNSTYIKEDWENTTKAYKQGIRST